MPVLNPAALARIVGRLLNSADVRVEEWQICRLSNGGNPVSAGVFLVCGAAEGQEAGADWTLVLKVIRPPGKSWTDVHAGGIHNWHWNYWRRETLLYRSGMLDSLPSGLEAPRLLGIEEKPDGTIWIWITEATGLSGTDWALQEYAIAAYCLGRFNGHYAGSGILPDDSWLSRGLLRQWCEHLTVGGNRTIDTGVPAIPWCDITADPVFHTDEARVFFDLMERREAILVALERLPQTLCHRDASPENLFLRVGADGPNRMTAIDWALAGIGSLGEELAPLTMGAARHLANPDVRDIAERLFEAYLKGLAEGGWGGDPQQARAGFIASTALRASLWMIWETSLLLERRREGEEVFDAGQERAARLAFEMAESALAYQGD